MDKKASTKILEEDFSHSEEENLLESDVSDLEKSFLETIIEEEKKLEAERQDMKELENMVEQKVLKIDDLTLLIIYSPMCDTCKIVKQLFSKEEIHSVITSYFKKIKWIPLSSLINFNVFSEIQAEKRNKALANFKGVGVPLFIKQSKQSVTFLSREFILMIVQELLKESSEDFSKQMKSLLECFKDTNDYFNNK